MTHTTHFPLRRKLRGNMTLAVLTLGVDFWQLPKIQFQWGSILSISGNRIFGNCQKSTAKVSTAKFMLPLRVQCIGYQWNCSFLIFLRVKFLCWGCQSLGFQYLNGPWQDVSLGPVSFIIKFTLILIIIIYLV
jgi:hypothetical protein